MRCLTALALALVLLPLTVHAQTQQPCQPPAPTGVSQSQSIFSEEQEADLGDAVAEHLQRNFRVIDDEEVIGYLNRIGERITRHLPPTKLRFQLFLVDLPDANAFVLPGGRIYVSRKLVALAQSEDELASVISHEIGHLVARHGAIGLTRLLREVLGVTEVKDRKDIFEKYNQLVENAARKPKAFGKDDGHNEEQIIADQIGLFALASAGYDPQSHARFFDRLVDTKGKTGNFFSDLFGTTKPEAKRLREMIKAVATLPAACVEARRAAPVEEFRTWQAAVINYTGLGRKEAIHGLRSKIALDPPLRGEITHIRFSPDGKYILAQDDSGINLLSREPFAPLFRIEAPEAKQAYFTPDSQDVIFSTSELRIEVWSVADQKLKIARELFVRKVCLQTMLSPDGKSLACLDSNLDLSLFDVATGTQVFQKKSFYTPSFLDFLKIELFNIQDSELGGGDEIDFINMSFSPDSRYFAAGAKSTYLNALGNFGSETNAIAVDLTTREQVSLKGPLKKFIAGGSTFIGSDRLVGIDRADPSKSAMVAFPSGEILSQIPLGLSKLSSPTRGNYLLIRPISKYPVGVMDIATKKIFLASKQSALDVYDQVYVSERLNGEVGLYGVEKMNLMATVLLPRNPLGRLRAVALSPDLKWLAFSERTRGGVWNLSKGERVFHVRGFRGGHFTDDGALYADFPKFDETERTLARLDLGSRQATAGSEVKETSARQFGPLVLLTKSNKKDGWLLNADVTIELQDARNLAPLWSRSFPKEAPKVWIDSGEATVVLSWPTSTNAAKAEIKSDAALARRLAAMKEKEGDYFLQVLDANTGKVLGRLLIETGKGSFRIENVFAANDWVVISDTENRVLVYSLSTGEQKGKVFGKSAAINSAGNLLCVENESGKLTIYDLVSMEKRDQLVFSSPVALMRFNRDGKSLFVLTASQMAYVLDISSLAR